MAPAQTRNAPSSNDSNGRLWAWGAAGGIDVRSYGKKLGVSLA